MTRPWNSLVHHHTRGTGVSLELPARFEPVDLQPESVTWAECSLDGGEIPHAVRVRVQAVGRFEELCDPFAAPADRIDLLRRTADAVAATGTVVRRVSGKRDGALTEELEVDTADGKHLSTTLVLTAGRLVSVVATTEQPDVDWALVVQLLRTSLRAVDPADHVPNAPDTQEDGDAAQGDEFTVWSDLDAGISLDVPAGWEHVAGEPGTLFFRAPAPGADGILPLFHLAPAQAGGESWEWFDVFVEQTGQELRDQQVQVLAEERFALSSWGADVHTVTARLGTEGDPVDPPRIQMLAWIWAAPERMWAVQAHTSPDAEADVARFDHMMRSIRLLSRR